MMIGTSTMSSDWNVNLKDMNAKDSSHTAKFRDLIREIKQRVSSADGDWDVEK